MLNISVMSKQGAVAPGKNRRQPSKKVATRGSSSRDSAKRGRRAAAAKSRWSASHAQPGGLTLDRAGVKWPRSNCNYQLCELGFPRSLIQFPSH